MNGNKEESCSEAGSEESRREANGSEKEDVRAKDIIRLDSAIEEDRQEEDGRDDA
jgi:hypothetical protein